MATFCWSSQMRRSATVARSSGAAFAASSCQSIEYRKFVLVDGPTLVLPEGTVHAEPKPKPTIGLSIPDFLREILISLVVAHLAGPEGFPNPSRRFRLVGLRGERAHGGVLPSWSTGPTVGSRICGWQSSPPTSALVLRASDIARTLDPSRCQGPTPRHLRRPLGHPGLRHRRHGARCDAARLQEVGRHIRALWHASGRVA